MAYRLAVLAWLNNTSNALAQRVALPSGTLLGNASDHDHGCRPCKTTSSIDATRVALRCMHERQYGHYTLLAWAYPPPSLVDRVVRSSLASGYALVVVLASPSLALVHPIKSMGLTFLHSFSSYVARKNRDQTVGRVVQPHAVKQAASSRSDLLAVCTVRN